MLMMYTANALPRSSSAMEYVLIAIETTLWGCDIVSGAMNEKAGQTREKRVGVIYARVPGDFRGESPKGSRTSV